MLLDLTGKHALVCGSTQGIGRACAVELASLGATITLAARDETKLRQGVVTLPRPRQQSHGTLVLDFSAPDAVKAAISAFAPKSPVHILINNTGGPPAGAAFDSKAEDYLACFQAQLIAAHHLVQAVAPGMKAASYGRIINITSTSVKQPIPTLGISNAVRAAVCNWAKSLSMDLGPFGITVNNVLPGYTSTERLGSLVAGRAKARSVDAESIEREFIASIPAGRFGEAHEIASAVAFLASPAAAYINGVNLPVDGGRLGCL